MKDLSTVKTSMTAILEESKEKINSAKSVIELHALLTDIFAEHKLNTKASNRLLSNVSKQRTIEAAQMTVYNSMLCGSGNAVI